MADLKKGFREIKEHWHVPAKGNYVPYKEWFYDILAVGGEESAGHGFNKLSFDAGCLLVMLIYKVPIQYFPMIALIGMPMGYLWSVINMVIADNLGFLPRKTTRIINGIYAPLFLAGLAMLIFVPTTAMEHILPGFWKFVGTNLVLSTWGAWRNVFWKRLLLEKLGRYKMFAYVNIIPRMVMLFLILFLPFRTMDLNNRVWILNLCFALFTMYSIGEPANKATDVITPNEKERIRIYAWPGTVANGVNSIFGFLLPAMAYLVGGYDQLNFFRILVPITIVGGLAIMFPALSRIHERIPMPPMAYKPTVNWWEGADAVLHNKYHWISMVSGLVDTLGTGTVAVTTVLFIYVLRDTGWMASLLSTLIITAVTPGILLAPLFHRIDYRKMYFITRSLSIVISSITFIALFMGVANPVALAGVVLGTSWLNTLVGYSMTTVKRSMDVNKLDYQMWISGERMESFAGIFGWFTGPITTMMGFMIPLIYKGMGFTSNWDILFMSDVRVKVMLAGCLLIIGGDIASMIPMFWFRFSKNQQKQIVKDLEWRAQAGQDLEPVNEAARNGGDPEAVLQQVIALRAQREAESE
jgi:Na+/melibiose symporter-like transporter